MIRVADEPPREWALVTRDLFEDCGPLTITGIGFTALEGSGTAYFDHVYLGRTLEDLDQVTSRLKNVVDPSDDAAPLAEQPATPSRWMARAGTIGVACALVLLVVFFLIRKRHGPKRQPVNPTNSGAVVDPTTSVAFACEHCGKKLKGKVSLAGKTINCPQCGKGVVVPGPSASA
jgi:hypothetical protein